ncbi:LLM class flavin-dependent oxidoreductase [Sphingobium boeckii]|uniref:Alkanesulfonate monooxygenase SsuD/methylene tetrahydromethanopterin reductase-like flavin-dependent oxidoreductase (Luciferase family) n=1 Tax=Sphingobium boeckii TaxID=1082345 RepID=A0A7W9AG23_9SPHN|nr:LLM class flavin-dependent oxidoreductase [Sphingobium boeckii]MBB5684836.1 alkanesulfonate monooxygenase SsuD/methylene tetrahydromethanopterin reductase-like flavin-dependent oxidoreductase (luciferase family) [Sphingobium boeckii]
MRFAISTIPLSYGPQHDEWVMEAELRMAQMADGLGYDLVMVGERHFSGAVGGNPLLSLATLAPRLTHAWLGTGVVLVPNYHPIRLAEMLNIIDHYTKGKAIIGLGSGMSPEDAVAFGFEVAQQTERMFNDNIDALIALWKKQSDDPAITIDGAHYKGTLLERITPTPYRKHQPYVKTTASSDVHIERAAREGWPVFFIKRDAEDASDLFKKYQTALFSHNHPANVLAHCADWTSVAKPSMHVAETDEQAAAEWTYLDGRVKPFMRTKLAYNERARELQGLKMPPANVELRHTEEFRAKMTVYGGIDTMIEHVRGFEDAGYGMFHLSLISPVDEEGMAIWERSVTLFAEKVMPHFRGVKPTWAKAAIG